MQRSSQLNQHNPTNPPITSVRYRGTSHRSSTRIPAECQQSIGF